MKVTIKAKDAKIVLKYIVKMASRLDLVAFLNCRQCNLNATAGKFCRNLGIAEGLRKPSASMRNTFLVTIPITLSERTCNLNCLISREGRVRTSSSAGSCQEGCQDPEQA